MKIGEIKVHGNSGTGIILNITSNGAEVIAPVSISVKCNSCGHIEHFDATHGMSASKCTACDTEDITIGQTIEDSE